MTDALVPANEAAVAERDLEGSKFVSAVVEVYAKAGLSEDEVRRVNENIDDLEKLITSFIAKNRHDPKLLAYHSGYRKPRVIVEQVNRLQELFPGVGDVNQVLLARIEKGEVVLPKHAEGWCAVVNWAKHPEIFGETYNDAVQKALDTLGQTLDRYFKNLRQKHLGSRWLRQSARSIEYWEKLSQSQGNPDILIVPMQFGLRYRGCSASIVRTTMEAQGVDEFGLGAFAVAIMLLTHPERLKNEYDGRIDCPGDEYDQPELYGNGPGYRKVPFSAVLGTPHFYFEGISIYFYAVWGSYLGRKWHGSASGFLFE